MECSKEKRSYHFNVTEVVDGKIQDVMSFNLGGHHDLAALSKLAEEKEGISEKHARQLVVGLRLMHHALKKYPDNAVFMDFLNQLNDFKHKLKGAEGCGCK